METLSTGSSRKSRRRVGQGSTYEEIRHGHFTASRKPMLYLIDTKKVKPVVGPEGGRIPRDLEFAIQRVRGAGQPLKDPIKERMSAALCHDFREVRVHTGPEADELTHKLNARAFTIGSDILFAQGAYDPDTPEGRELIAHELIHVVQQRPVRASDVVSNMVVSPAGDEFEQEAEILATRVTAQPSMPFNNRVTIRMRAKPPLMIQRDLGTYCRTQAPGTGEPGGKNVPCHYATLWWIYLTQHPETPINNDGFKAFMNAPAFNNKSAADLIARLVSGYGRKRSLWWTHGDIIMDPGSVVVFASSKDAAGVGNGHSCVCAQNQILYGHNQGNWFTSCHHGKTGIHCHHCARTIAWSSRSNVRHVYSVYSISSHHVTQWAKSVYP